MNEQSEHLSNAQIENYGDRTSGAGPDADREAEQVEAHLQDCSSCRSRVLDFQRTHFALLADPKQSTDQPVNPASTPDCPSEDDLRQLAAGLLPEAVGDKLTRHAATCDHCGPLLRIYTEDFSDDFSQEEQAVLSSLQSSSARWQKKTAQQMLGVARATAAGVRAGAAASAEANAGVTEANAGVVIAVSPAGGRSALASRSPLFWKWTIPAATAACALIAFSIWYTQRDTPEKVEKLLAQAYTEQRTMEMRWPGADWGPVRVTRGASASLARPSSMYAAEKILSERQADSSSSLNWLRAKAEAELLDNQPQAAIAELNQALAIAPNSTPLTLLLAIAHAQQGDLSDDHASREKALQYFNQVLQQEPTNPSARFNRALVYQKLEMREKAATDWKTLLLTEKDNDWAQEARSKLNELEKPGNQ